MVINYIKRFINREADKGIFFNYKTLIRLNRQEAESQTQPEQSVKGK